MKNSSKSKKQQVPKNLQSLLDEEKSNNKKLCNMVAKLKSDLNNMISNKSTMSSKIDHMQQQLNNLQAKCNDANETSVNLETSLNEEKSRTNKLKDEIEKLNSAIGNMVSKDKARNLEDENKVLKDNLTVAQDKYKAVHETESILRNDNEQLQSELEKVKKENVILRNKLGRNDLNKTIQGTLDNQVQSLKKKLEVVQRYRKDDECKISNLGQEINWLRSVIDHEFGKRMHSFQEELDKAHGNADSNPTTNVLGTSSASSNSTKNNIVEVTVAKIPPVDSTSSVSSQLQRNTGRVDVPRKKDNTSVTPMKKKARNTNNKRKQSNVPNQSTNPPKKGRSAYLKDHQWREEYDIYCEKRKKDTGSSVMTRSMIETQRELEAYKISRPLLKEKNATAIHKAFCGIFDKQG